MKSTRIFVIASLFILISATILSAAGPSAALTAVKTIDRNSVKPLIQSSYLDRIESQNTVVLSVSLVISSFQRGDVDLFYFLRDQGYATFNVNMGQSLGLQVVNSIDHFQLTPKGWAELKVIGNKIYVNVAKAELVEVTGITKDAQDAQVEFIYRIQPTAIGSQLARRPSGFWTTMGVAQTAPAHLSLRLYDDGWRAIGQ